MKRRTFITLLGGATAWPLTARAQQPALPAIGYLNFGSPESDAPRLTGVRRGLNQTGYVEGRNLVIEYRWAGNQADRLPALAADLVQLRVAVIVTSGLVSTLAAQAATTSIPIVFTVAADPVQFGLVASLNRPGGNLTGFFGFSAELGAKGLAEEARREFDRIAAVEPRERIFNPEGWRKLKGARELDPAGRQVLRALWIAREERARGDDRPPFKVLGEQQLVEIARHRPVGEAALSAIPGVTPAVLRRMRAAIAAALEAVAAPRTG